MGVQLEAAHLFEATIHNFHIGHYLLAQGNGHNFRMEEEEDDEASRQDEQVEVAHVGAHSPSCPPHFQG